MSSPFECVPFGFNKMPFLKTLINYGIMFELQTFCHSALPSLALIDISATTSLDNAIFRLWHTGS